MPEKDPSNWGALTWILATCFPAAAGLVNWYAKVKSGRARAFNIVELIGEVFASAIVGLGVFMALDGLGQPVGVCAAAAGLAGHMGTRLLFLLEQQLESYLKQKQRCE